MDEAGYGPRLGPLVIAATHVRGELPDECPVPVGDSKKVYTPAKGVRVLERSVLAFAGQFLDLSGLTYGKFRKRIAGGIPNLPWYGDFDLPVAAEDIPAEEIRSWLGGVEIGAAAAVVEPEEVNGVDNKADLLFDREAEIIRGILKRHPDEPALFRIGKHGSRRFYGAKLSGAFGVMFRVEREEADGSVYTASIGGRDVRFEFLRDGEDRDFCLALGSMFAKYLREGAMRLFNEYWQERIEGLRPTAGYPADADRFFDSIKAELRRLKVAPELVYRNR
jgi:hypothetical protein